MNDREDRAAPFQSGARPCRWRHREEVRAIAGRSGLFASAMVEALLESLDSCALPSYRSKRFAFIAQCTRYETAVGIATGGILPGRRGSCHLSTLLVDVPHRRRGFGRELLRASERSTRTMGGTEVVVELPGRRRRAANTAFLGASEYRLRSTASPINGETAWYYVRVPANKERTQ